MRAVDVLQARLFLLSRRASALRQKKPEPLGSGCSVGWFARRKPDLDWPNPPDPADIRHKQEPSGPSPSPKPQRNDGQALRRGRRVRSLICVRMLDICIPFNCETKGIISAMKGSFISSMISS
jgi:hypothetical protein